MDTTARQVGSPYIYVFSRTNDVSLVGVEALFANAKNTRVVFVFSTNRHGNGREIRNDVTRVR